VQQFQAALFRAAVVDPVVHRALREVAQLAAAGVPVWIDDPARMAHAKTMVVDGAVTLTGGGIGGLRGGLARDATGWTWWIMTDRPLSPVPALRRYVAPLCAVVYHGPAEVPTTDIEVDGIAERWYKDPAAMKRANASADAKASPADGTLFIGRIKSFITEEKVVIRRSGADSNKGRRGRAE
jgi:hypothetical protein